MYHIVYFYFYLKGKNSGYLDIQINTNVFSYRVCVITLSVGCRCATELVCRPLKKMVALQKRCGSVCYGIFRLNLVILLFCFLLFVIHPCTLISRTI